MTSPKGFPLNAWYAAAWGREIEHALSARTVCDKDVVLYRRSTGQVAALEDACWHRLLPLSMGRLDGDEVVCGYHGLVFNAEGRCTFMPAQQTINPSACVKAYPVVERHRLVWIWPGDPALADPALVPDFHWNDGTDWVGEGGTFYDLGCDYRLVIDNLMDLTHETYVHAGSIGDEAITSAPFEVTHTDRTATVTRWMIDIDPPPFWKSQLDRPGARADRWQIIYFQAPSTVVGDVGVAVTGTGAPQGDRSQGVNGAFLAAVTPAREGRCHYFWNFVRTFRKDDAALTAAINKAHVNDGQGVYDQDHAVLEAQQKAIERNPRMPFYNLNIDAGALWARRLIDGLIEREQGAATAATLSGTVAAE
jgi:phenylpropionate dioxygenase-like ring-hydroxylating dioxygenase large terminal subunit